MTRLRTIEERLGFTINVRHAELEVALRLDELRRSAANDELDDGVSKLDKSHALRSPH